MRIWTKRALTMLLVLALTACALACADDKYDFRTGSITASADTAPRTAYEDDTLTLYTVAVPKQCVKVSIQPLGSETKQAFTADSEGVTISVEDDTATWLIPCDFGPQPIDGVTIEAQIPMGKKADYLSTDLPVSIRLPQISAEEPDAAYTLFALHNADEPCYFLIAPENEEAVLKAFAEPSGLLYPQDAAPVIEIAEKTGDFPGMSVPEGAYLMSFYIPNDPFAACYAGEGTRLSDSVRAALMGQKDAVPDDTLYPVAKLMLDGARLCLDGLPLEALTPYEQYTALYERVYNLGRVALVPEDFAALPAEERAYYEETAYGPLSGFGGNSFGYADTLKLLCDLAGLPCAVLPCTLASGEPYCVNAVQLEDEWFIVDACAAAQNPDGDMYARYCLSGNQAQEFYVFAGDAPALSSREAYNKHALPSSAAGETPEPQA